MNIYTSSNCSRQKVHFSSHGFDEKKKQAYTNQKLNNALSKLVKSYLSAKSKGQKQYFAKVIKGIIIAHNEDRKDLQKGNIAKSVVGEVDKTNLIIFDTSDIDKILNWKQEERWEYFQDDFGDMNRVAKQDTHWFKDNAVIYTNFVKTISLDLNQKERISLSKQDRQAIENYLEDFMKAVNNQFTPNCKIVSATIHWDEVAQPHIHWTIENYDNVEHKWTANKKYEQAFLNNQFKEFEAEFDRQYHLKWLSNNLYCVQDIATTGMKYLTKPNEKGMQFRVRNQREFKEAYSENGEDRQNQKMNYLFEVANNIIPIPQMIKKQIENTNIRKWIDAHDLNEANRAEAMEQLMEAFEIVGAREKLDQEYISSCKLAVLEEYLKTINESEVFEIEKDLARDMINTTYDTLTPQDQANLEILVQNSILNTSQRW